jgi:hypothetical protein
LRTTPTKINTLTSFDPFVLLGPSDGPPWLVFKLPALEVGAASFVPNTPSENERGSRSLESCGTAMERVWSKMADGPSNKKNYKNYSPGGAANLISKTQNLQWPLVWRVRHHTRPAGPLAKMYTCRICSVEQPLFPSQLMKEMTRKLTRRQGHWTTPMMYSHTLSAELHRWIAQNINMKK